MSVCCREGHIAYRRRYLEIFANFLAFVNRFAIANDSFRLALGDLCDPPSAKKSEDANAKISLYNDFVVVLAYEDFKNVSLS